MNTSGRLVFFIFISLIIHSLLFFILKPETESVEPSIQAVSVSLKRRVEPVAEPEALAETIPRSEAVPEPKPETEKKLEQPAEKDKVEKEKVISPQTSEPPAEPVIAQSTDLQSAAVDTVETSSEVESSTQTGPASNPFEGLIRRIDTLKDSTYPLRAKKRGYQGTVVIELNLDFEGELISASIFQKSRHSILNNAALELIEKVFEQPYPHNTGKNVTLRIPITYKLI